MPASFVASSCGTHVIPFMYLGAKHMVTGYDHLLFLAGVIFFLYRLKDVALYATLFALGHSTTLLLGVLAGIHANAYIVDAIIGASVVYKAFENLGGFRRLRLQLDSRAAVLLFGLAHGFGLATKLLALILIGFNLWRRSGSFVRGAWAANVLIMAAGFALMGFQLTGYWVQA
jgi:HupE / UreJ protein